MIYSQIAQRQSFSIHISSHGNTFEDPILSKLLFFHTSSTNQETSLVSSYCPLVNKNLYETEIVDNPLRRLLKRIFLLRNLNSLFYSWISGYKASESQAILSPYWDQHYQHFRTNQGGSIFYKEEERSLYIFLKFRFQDLFLKSYKKRIN